jgi:hypothetical protein
MTADELTTARLLRALFEGISEEEARRDWSSLATSVGNRLAIETVARSRQAALRVLQKYHGDDEDFLAVCYIIACQSLFFPHLQTGVVRSAVSALSSALSRRAQRD